MIPVNMIPNSMTPVIVFIASTWLSTTVKGQVQLPESSALH